MDIAVVTTFAALILVAGSLGGGVYETALIDRLWPDNPALVQPSRGGINRKRFWMPAHFAFEALLGAALWSAWTRPDARRWLLAALVAHVAMRAWSFAYFIPRAIAFEKAGDFNADQHGVPPGRQRGVNPGLTTPPRSSLLAACSSPCPS